MPRKRPANQALLYEQGLKHCASCDRTLQVTAFNADRSTNRGLAAYCRECNKRKSKRRYAEHTERHKELHLKNEFGISFADYNRLLEEQSGGCAICGKTPAEEGRRLSVDHSHDSGLVRGLLCSKHNFGIGQFDDDPVLLAKAIDYLTEANVPTSS